MRCLSHSSLCWSKETSRSQTDGAGDLAACTSPSALLGAPAFLGQVSFPLHFWKSFLNPTLDLLSEDEDHPSHMEQGEPGRGQPPVRRGFLIGCPPSCCLGPGLAHSWLRGRKLNQVSRPAAPVPSPPGFGGLPPLCRGPAHLHEVPMVLQHAARGLPGVLIALPWVHPNITRKRLPLVSILTLFPWWFLPETAAQGA